MDIHKPKPWHSFREFLKEYVIIVVGVLTALAGEAVVEWTNRAEEVREARASIHNEIAVNAAIAAYGIDEENCLTPRLRAYDAWARNGGPRPPEHSMLTIPLRWSTWDTVKTGAVTHMPLKERLALADFYGWVTNYQGALERERDASMEIHAIYARGKLDGVAAGRMLEAVKRADNLSGVRTSNARLIIDSAAALGVKPKAPAGVSTTRLRDALAQACAPPPASS
jgi:hypothetical protein